MNKANLQKFIDKYHLAGNIESVIWDSNGTLNCGFVSDSQHLIGNVIMKNNPIAEAKVGLFKTSQLTKLLTAMDNDIDVTFEGDDSQKFAISISDKRNSAKFMLADQSVIKTPPPSKQFPAWDVQVVIDDAFIMNFIKARNAVPEASNFAIKSTGTKATFIINYQSTNTNRLSFDVDTIESSEIEPIAFSADLLKEVLVANKGTGGTMNISSKGLIEVKFDDKDFESTYFLVKQTVN